MESKSFSPQIPRDTLQHAIQPSSFRLDSIISLTERLAAIFCSLELQELAKPPGFTRLRSNLTCLVPNSCLPFIKGICANVPAMLLSKGSDAPLALRALFRQCVEMAPSILVLDPLTTLAVRNPSRQIDMSLMDQAFLSELCRILEEAKEGGVTLIGVTIDKALIQERILQSFDEQVLFILLCFHPDRVFPSQSARSIALFPPSLPLLYRIRRIAAVGRVAETIRRFLSPTKPFVLLERH